MKLTFIEEPGFTEDLTELDGSDDLLRELQKELLANPDKGPVVKGTGGLRKVRMRLKGRGKSGEARVLYLYFPEQKTILFFMLYLKGDIENVSKSQLEGIRHAVQRIKDYYTKKTC